MPKGSGVCSAEREGLDGDLIRKWSVSGDFGNGIGGE